MKMSCTAKSPEEELDLNINIVNYHSSKENRTKRRNEHSKNGGLTNESNNSVTGSPLKRKRRTLLSVDSVKHIKDIELDDVTPVSEEVFSTSAEFLKDYVDSRLLRVVKESFNLKEITHVQRQAIPAILNSNDVLIKSQTGTGKTLAYCLPMIQMLQSIEPPITRADGPYAVILLPTRELSIQTTDVIQKLLKPFVRIVCGCLIGGTNRKHEKDRIRKGVNIVVGTPGRIEDHVNNTASLNLSNVRFVVLDEADRMLDMGFKKSMDTILNSIGTCSKQKQVILLSATLTSAVEELGVMHLKSPEFIDLSMKSISGVGTDHQIALPAKLKHFYVIVPFKLRLVALCAFIMRKFKKAKQEKLLIFLSTNDSILFHYEILDNALNSNDEDSFSVRKINFLKLHGNMSLEERKTTFSQFISMKSGVLLCTDVAARGLDFEAITWIVQYNSPGPVEDYVHRVGRTARLDSKGKALLFLAPSETEYLKHLNALNIDMKALSLPLIFKSLGTSIQSASNEENIQELQFTFEELVNSSAELKQLARNAFVSFVRSYATYKSPWKTIFHPKNLHFGHVAKSFALRETPTDVMKSDLQNFFNNRKENSVNHRSNGYTKRNSGFHGLKQNIDLLSEFASGL